MTRGPDQQPALWALTRSLGEQVWRQRAACAGAPEDFVDVISDAQAETLCHRYCGRCPVMLQCRDEGESLRHHGRTIYGGQVHYATGKVRRWVA